jgi:hypothetical protein
VIRTDDWDFEPDQVVAREPLTPIVALWSLVLIPLLPGLLDGSIELVVIGGCLSIIALVMSVTALAQLEAEAPARTIIPARDATRERRCRTKPQSRPRLPTRHPPRTPRRRRQARCAPLRPGFGPVRPWFAGALRRRRGTRHSRP